MGGPLHHLLAGWGFSSSLPNDGNRGYRLRASAAPRGVDLRLRLTRKSTFAVLNPSHVTAATQDRLQWVWLPGEVKPVFLRKPGK
jgi:hypothetical protein